MQYKGFQEHRGIFGYLSDHVKRNGVFMTANKVVKYARRYIFISRIIKYMSLIIAIIETSAILVALTVVLLAAIPIMLVVSGIVTIIGLHKRKECNRELKKLFAKDKELMFIYTEHGYNDKHSKFLRGMAKDFKEQGYAVFVVSSSVFRDRFTTGKKIEEDLWVIKLNYFYSIKKRFIKNYDNDKLTYIS